MSSVLQSVRKRKKRRRLGEGKVVSREAYVAREEVGRYEMALEQYDRKLAVDPEDEKIALLEGLTYFRMTRYEDALRYLSEAAGYEERDPEAAYYRGRVLEAMGRTEEARTSYENALALEAGSEEARAGLARLRSPKD